MSLRSVMGLLANLGEAPRMSQGADSHTKSTADTNLRNACESCDSHLLLCTCAGARAREEEIAEGDSSDTGESHAAPSLKVTVLKHCRCIDCRKFHADGCGNYYCDSHIGGTSVVWATGNRECDPPPGAWHYCADYHGPQLSPDVWAWPSRPGVEVVEMGPSGPASAEYRVGNGSGAGLFRSLSRTQPAAALAGGRAWAKFPAETACRWVDTLAGVTAR